MVEISFSRWSQILFDLEFCADAFDAFGNPKMAERLRLDFTYMKNISEESKNEFKGFTE